MNGDNSVQAIIFRLWKGAANDGEMKNYKKSALQSYGRPYVPTRGKIPTIIGKRNGVPVGADQDYYQQQRGIMRKKMTRPYKSNQLHDILPTIYNGNVNILASSGGAPLAFALDDESELQERLYSEGIRGSSSNPLSARYAIAAHQNREPPVIGGATDVMRRELAGQQDDDATMARKLNSGHLGDPRKQSAFLQANSEIDPEIQAFQNGRRAPTKKDFDGYSSKFISTVKEIDQNGIKRINGLRNQVNNLNLMASGALPNVYNIVNAHAHVAGPAANLAAVTPVQPAVAIQGMATPPAGRTIRGRGGGSSGGRGGTSSSGSRGGTSSSSGRGGRGSFAPTTRSRSRLIV